MISQFPAMISIPQSNDDNKMLLVPISAICNIDIDLVSDEVRIYFNRRVFVEGGIAAIESILVSQKQNGKLNYLYILRQAKYLCGAVPYPVEKKE